MSHWTRRQMLQAAGAGVAALALGQSSAPAQEEKGGKAKGFTLPKLPYAYDALEPHIDKETMQIHHDKHHAAYVANLNKAVAGDPKLAGMPVDELLARIEEVPEKIRTAVRNNGGGHSNHTIFWEIMGPKGKGGGKPTGDLGKAIDDRFGSFDNFQKRLSNFAITLFGSGWAWLVLDKDGKLHLAQSTNQDSPLMTGYRPLMGIDVWEHAYYLKYKNLRPKYVEAWWNVVNWKAVADRYAKYRKG
jgi:superoxide dismutase, Fe-Mn family